MRKLTRVTRGAVIAMVLAAVWAAPTAAAQPLKFTHRDLHPFSYGADTACAFEVDGVPDFGLSTYWILSDGTIKGSVHAHGAYVNAETGARFPGIDTYSYTQWTDPVSGVTYVTVDGRAAASFLPGDPGPFGTVGAHGAFYDIVGHVTLTVDASGKLTTFLWKGIATDICAALS